MPNTYRDIFTKLQVEVSKLNPNELTIVTYHKDNHDLQFSQLEYTFIASYLRPYYLSKKGFKIGVLTPSGLNKLKYNLEQLLKNNLIDDLEYIPDLNPLSTKWYRWMMKGKLTTPEIAIDLTYVNVTNKLMTKILCNHFNNNSRIVYKLMSKSK